MFLPVLIQVEADDREGDRQERMRQRAQLVQQLQQEQAASEALVEALKQVREVLCAGNVCGSCMHILLVSWYTEGLE